MSPAARSALVTTLALLAPWRAAATVASQHRQITLLIRTLAAELAGTEGPLSRDRVVRYLGDAVVEQGRLISQLRGQSQQQPRRLRLVGPGETAPYAARHRRRWPRLTAG